MLWPCPVVGLQVISKGMSEGGGGQEHWCDMPLQWTSDFSVLVTWATAFSWEDKDGRRGRSSTHWYRPGSSVW